MPTPQKTVGCNKMSVNLTGRISAVSRGVVGKTDTFKDKKLAIVEKTIPPFIYDEDAIREGAKAKFALSGAFNIDRWPEEIRALSMPTKLIEVDAEDFEQIFDYRAADWKDRMQRYSDLLDAEMGWDRFMVRLNSRSPKDASYPIMPITCSGKHAMLWLSTSMRVMDDVSLHKCAGEPLFVALREWRPIRIEWEFRCFVKDGKVIAVSRYDYSNPPAEDFAADMVMTKARGYYEQHLAKHYGEVVFDLALGVQKGGGPLLIELNPYGLSDPCCFGSYQAVETIGGYAHTPIAGE